MYYSIIYYNREHFPDFVGAVIFSEGQLFFKTVNNWTEDKREEMAIQSLINRLQLENPKYLNEIVKFANQEANEARLSLPNSWPNTKSPEELLNVVFASRLIASRHKLFYP